MTKNDLLDSATKVELRSNTKWVKGELFDNLDPELIDPRQLLEGEKGNTPFDRLNWFNRVASHWQGHCTPLIVRAWNEGQHCWLFLARDENAGLTALANWYSMAFRPIFVGGVAPDLLQAIAKRMRASTSVPSLITLAPVPRADGSSDLILAAFRKSGWIAFRHQSSTSWTANVNGMSFDQYWSNRPSQLRNTAKRKAKKSEIATEILTRFDESAWSAYESVYGDSWKSAEGSPAFLREMAQYDSDNGQFRLGLARLEGQVIAAQYWTVSGGVAYIHKLAHREEFRDLSAGTILSEALFRHVIDVDHVDTIDFGTGNDTYKADWMDRSDPLDTIRLFKATTVSGLVGAIRARISALVRRTSLD